MEKNQAKAKQHASVELSLFESYLLSSSTLLSKNNQLPSGLSKAKPKRKTITLKEFLICFQNKIIHFGADADQAQKFLHPLHLSFCKKCTKKQARPI